MKPTAAELDHARRQLLLPLACRAPGRCSCCHLPAPDAAQAAQEGPGGAGPGERPHDPQNAAQGAAEAP